MGMYLNNIGLAFSVQNRESRVESYCTSVIT